MDLDPSRGRCAAPKRASDALTFVVCPLAPCQCRQRQCRQAVFFRVLHRKVLSVRYTIARDRGTTRDHGMKVETGVCLPKFSRGAPPRDPSHREGARRSAPGSSAPQPSAVVQRVVSQFSKSWKISWILILSLSLGSRS